MNSPDWLTVRPIAHRALHDAPNGVIENTRSAVAAALRHGFSIEVDVQLSADGEAMVFHDDDLDRLTFGQGTTRALGCSTLKSLELRGTSDRMMTLSELLTQVKGAVPLIIEMKSHFNGDVSIARRAVDVLATYSGPAALMSFDPDLVTATGRFESRIPRGFIMERRYDDPEWDFLTPRTRFVWSNLLNFPQMRPDFLAHYVRDLPSPAVALARRRLALPVLTWTVRSEEDRARAARYADQMIFEGFLPS